MNLPKHPSLFVLVLIGSYLNNLAAEELKIDSTIPSFRDDNHVCKLSKANPDNCQHIWKIAESGQKQTTPVPASANKASTPFLPAELNPDTVTLQAIKQNYLKDPQLLIKSLKHRNEVVRSQAVFYALKNPEINADSVIDLAIQDKSQRVKAMALETNKLNIAQIKRLQNDSDPEIANLAKLKADQYAQ